MSEALGATRPRRSLLYVPASNPRAIDKARGLPCDGVILDLEDSVAPESKAQAREAAIEALVLGFGGRETILRCNGLDTGWGEADFAAAAVAGPDAVLAPKIGSLDDILACDRWLATAPERTRLWAMIETAQAVLNLREIAGAAAMTRLSALVLGPNDLKLDLGLPLDAGPEPMRPVLSGLVVAARANGLAVIGGAFTGIDDAAGFEADAREEAAFGFDGKSLVHPAQIEAANRIFSPSPAALDWARAVVEAFAAPEAAGKGVLRLRGAMVERLHLEQARRLLRRAGS